MNGRPNRRSPAINRQAQRLRWLLGQGRCIVVARLGRGGDPREDGMNDTQIDGLHGRIDKLTVEMRAGFDQTQAAFADHRQYAEFLTQGVRDDVNGVRKDVNGVREDVSGVREDVSCLRDEVKTVREDVTRLRTQMSARFNHVERRFDGVTEQFDSVNRRFDRLEQLIRERP